MLPVILQFCIKKHLKFNSDFLHVRYLRQVIDETLRCAVVAPWAARYQDFDSELGGHKIPKNVRQLPVALVNSITYSMYPQQPMLHLQYFLAKKRIFIYFFNVGNSLVIYFVSNGQASDGQVLKPEEHIIFIILDILKQNVLKNTIFQVSYNHAYVILMILAPGDRF
jgi:hypothetical protein